MCSITMSKDYVPLCTMGDGTTIMTTRSFWRWLNQNTTDGQISKLKYLVYNYNITINVPTKCGFTSRKINDIEKAIRAGKVTARKSKHGRIESRGRYMKFVPMNSKVKA